jgi:uncharacterized protein (TIGR03000 family)
MLTNYCATMLRRRGQHLLGVSLLMMGLVEVGLSIGRAEVHYNGALITTRRREDGVTKTTPKSTMPRTPSSYSPDNDLDSASIYRGAEAERSQSPTVRLPTGLAVTSFPWNQTNFEDYNDALEPPQDTSLSGPSKYTLEVATLRPRSRNNQMDTAGLVAHLPEHALLWVEGTRTRLTGRTRYFQSPPLKPGHKYSYRVRAVWIEDGHWVSQTQTVFVESGRIEAIYLQHRPR